MDDNKKAFRKYTRILWIIYGAAMAFVILLFTAISLGWLGFMPGFEELENPDTSLASEIYSADEVLLGKYYIENRSNTTYDELSPNIVDALIATEDIRFVNHSAIDVKALLRVMAGVITGNNKGGGSTLTQQLAKNLFPRKANYNKLDIIIIKFKEWVTAVKLERNYTKQEILAMYLNTVAFGNNAYGIKSACRIFFNKTPEEVTVEEAAVLVGILRAPSYYSPVRHPDRATKRRNVVLGQMKQYSFLSPTEFDSIASLPLDMSGFKRQDHTTGLAKHFREYIRLVMHDWCKNHTKADGTNYNLYRDGLRIFTTIDSRMQVYAEEAINEHLGLDLQPAFNRHWKGYTNGPFVFNKNEAPQQIEQLMQSAMKRSERYRNLRNAGISNDSIQKSFVTPVEMTVFSWNGSIDTVMSPMDSIHYYKRFLRTGLMSIEPSTGHVKAYACGPDYAFFQFDNVTHMRRQVGSTFKPFLYTLAMQEGEFSPCSTVPNVQVSIDLGNGETWEPRNDSEDERGREVSLKWALAHSNNWISGRLIKRYGPQPVIQMARRMGVTSDIPEVYSIALGTADLSLYEMVGALNTFTNKGVYIEPIFITRIEDRNGNVLDQFMPKQQEAMSEETAFLMIELLKGVVQTGTGVRLRYKYGFDTPIAGKTGTTQNNSDGWFMGLTPKLTTGVWTGCEDRAAHFRTITLGQGANMALPVFALFLEKLYADTTLNFYRGDFDKPLKPLSVEIDCDKWNEQHSKQNNPYNEENEF
ncbi:MAG TPA: transglycosylase domain-containing protein [Bacteroidales bacterium]|nr:transglycosylase domain-containing protein [Bacteroidales bacterium]